MQNDAPTLENLWAVSCKRLNIYLTHGSPIPLLSIYQEMLRYISSSEKKKAWYVNVYEALFISKMKQLMYQQMDG